MRDFAPDSERHGHVSFHAVTRYVQRILRITLPEPPRGADPRRIADAHCREAGTTIDEVRAMIATSPAVIVARRMGVGQVGTGAFRACLQGGIVVTIMEPFKQRRGGFRSEPSRAELQRMLRRDARRRRKRKRFEGAAEEAAP